MSTSSDIRPLRELAKRYAEIAASAPQQERRDLWRAHNSLQNTRTPVLATFGMWNVWCREVFADAAMACRDPFYREFERSMRMAIFAHESGDDQIIEPWVTMQAVRERGWGTIWGVKEESEPSGVEGGAWKFRPVLETWEDVRKLSWPKHVIDEAATERNAARLVEAVGDIVPVNVSRAPVCVGFMSDIATSLARLRGLEQLMMDMCEFPEELKKVLAFMRDGILKNQRQAEVAGDFGRPTATASSPATPRNSPTRPPTSSGESGNNSGASAPPRNSPW